MRAALRLALPAAPALRHALRRWALVVVALAALPVFAGEYKAGSLVVDQAYARPTPPGARTGAVYFTIRNGGHDADRLVEVASPASQGVELHAMKMDGNLMKMRAVAALDIPAGGSVTLGASGYHVMLVGLEHPLAVGDKVPLTLTFEQAGPVTIVADVVSATGDGQHKH